MSITKVLGMQFRLQDDPTFNLMANSIERTGVGAPCSEEWGAEH